MICKKCGKDNNDEDKVCAQCGEVLEGTVINSENEVKNEESKEVKSKEKTNIFKKFMVGFVGIIMYIWNVLLEPMTVINSEKESFKGKKSFVLALKITLIAVLITILMTILSCTIAHFKGGYHTFSNIAWIGIVIRQTLFWMVMILAVAGIFFIAGLIIKKSISYTKFVGIVATSVIPVMVITHVIAPIVTYVHLELGLLVGYVGYISMYIVLLSQMNEELELKNEDKKIYVDVVCSIALILLIYALGMCGVKGL